jgi:peptidoglycan/LPS O-acetylase OafA/YrhL
MQLFVRGWIAKWSADWLIQNGVTIQAVVRPALWINPYFCAIFGVLQTKHHASAKRSVHVNSGATRMSTVNGRVDRVLLVENISQVRYTSLDGLRGLAILFVMIYHFGLSYQDIHSANPLMQIAQLGWLGVDLFFVLSGFLITGILLETKNHHHYFRNFLARRFLRIWPLYYLSLIVIFVLVPLFIASLPESLQAMRDKQSWFWLYSANWLFAKEGGFEQTPGGYYWSLAVEEQFYIVWPVVVYFLGNKSLLKASFVLLGACVCLRYVLLSEGVEPNSVYTMTITRLDGLLAGAIVALSLRDSVWSERLAKYVPYGLTGSLVGLVVVRLFVSDGFFWQPEMARYGYFFAAVAGAGLLVVALSRPPGSMGHAFLNTPLLRTMGKYSYALYLVHVPVAMLCERVILGKGDQVMGYKIAYGIFVLAAFGISLSLSALSWIVFEKRILSLKKYFSYQA